MPRIKPQPIQLMIAGPGAGKTHQMVERITEKLPSLNPHRHMAVITYTNAAAHLIQERLLKKCSVPGNVFIGTIHSFLNRFILTPHAKLVGVLPPDVKFIDNIAVSPANIPAGDKEKLIRIENAIKKNARENGYVTYGDIETLSCQILTNTSINPNRKLTRQAIAQRLEHIFVDEYQDATKAQHTILAEILKEGITSLTCVGDPEQYIFSFTYHDKHRKAPEFTDLPIMELASIPGQPPTRIKDNRRSTQKIIDLLNMLNTQVQQQISGDMGERIKNYPVSFLPETSIKELCNRFSAELVSLGFEEKHQRLLLAKENNTVDQIAVEAKCGRVSNDNSPSRGILSETLRFIAGILGFSQKEIREKKNLSLLAWRNLGFIYLGKLRECNVSTPNDAKTLAEELTGIKAASNPDFETDMKGSFVKLFAGKCGTAELNIACSTIHKAKGLEADAVLVIADSQNELRKWLETDRGKRFEDKVDSCRIGFVAFGRARLFLAIACLEPISADLKKQISSMGIELADPRTAT